jgi:hypothetical protein
VILWHSRVSHSTQEEIVNESDAKALIKRAKKLLDGGYKGRRKGAVETIAKLPVGEFEDNHVGYYRKVLGDAEAEVKNK